MKIQSCLLEKNSWSITMDFIEDLEKMARSLLKTKGYSDEDLSNYAGNLLLVYFKNEQLTIIPKPRQVMYSKQFKCPEGYEKALKEFIEKVNTGKDLSKFMSTKSRWIKRNFNDDLLNDWGIYHFHLTRRFHEDGTAKRSKYQLFACCDDNTVYLVQIYPHDMKNVYSQKELLLIVKDNWSHLLYFLDDGKLSEQISDETRASLRSNHCMTLTEIDDKIYFPRGGGYASDGSSINAVRKHNLYLNQVHILERVFKDKNIEIMEYIQSKLGMELNRHWTLKLLKTNAYSFTIIELINLIVMHLNLSGNSLQITETKSINPFSRNNYSTTNFFNDNSKLKGITAYMSNNGININFTEDKTIERPL